MLLTRKFSLSFLFISQIFLLSVLWMPNVFPISPFYLCVIPIVGFFLYFKSKTTRNNYNVYFAYLSSLLMFIYLLFNAMFTETTLKEALVLAFSLFYYVFTDSILYKIKNPNDLKKIVKLLIIVTSIYLFVDFYIRFLSIDFSNIPEWISKKSFFYVFKGFGLYGDSNSTGVVGFCVLYLSYFYKTVVLHNKDRQFRRLHFVLFIAVFATFCRAGLVSFIALVMFFHLYYRRNGFIRFFCIFSFVVFLFFALVLFISDASFQTKLYIFKTTFQYLQQNNDLTSLLFGLGANNEVLILNGGAAHNPFCTYLIDYGLLGFIIWVNMLFCICFDVGSFSIFIIVPYLLMAFSFSPLHISYLFAVLAIIKHTQIVFGLNFKNGNKSIKRQLNYSSVVQ